MMGQNKSSKRVVICGLTLLFGGAERVISVLSGEFLKSYENIELLLYYDEEICYDLNPSVKVTVIERENHTRGKIKNLLWMRKYLRKNADIIISFLAPLNMLVLAATLGLRCHKIVADRSDPHKAPANSILRKCRNYLYRFADVIVVQTKASYEYFPVGLRNKIEIIYNPISVKKEDVGIALRTEKKDIVVCVGRMIQSKNPKMLLTAFESFHKDFPAYQLVWYGNGEMREELERWVTEKKLEDCIFMPGNEKNVIHKIATAKMFVMTSDFEGMPNALIEAMCIGIPSICTKVAGAVELIRHGENGLLVGIGDAAECSAAMRRLAEDKEFAEYIGKNAMKLAEMLSIKKIAKDWLTILQKES